MRLLMCLSEHAGEVVSIDDLLNQVWSGVIVTQDSVYQSVASLRRLLGDDPKQPTYIATVPRLGYRLIAAVSPWTDPSVDAPPPAPRRGAAGLLITAGVAAICLAIGAFVLRGSGTNTDRAAHAAPQPSTSIAVLPFVDLTEAMTEEPFADGMTVEVINKLTKIPGLRVHAPLSPAKLKGKRFSVIEMAKMLAVTYVVDGSVRRSGDRLRVSARLLRGNDEFVVWSDTYDRSLGDILNVQDEITRQITKSVVGSL